MRVIIQSNLTMDDDQMSVMNSTSFLGLMSGQEDDLTTLIKRIYPTTIFVCFLLFVFLAR